MAYPQLTGRTPPNAEQSTSKTILFSVLALAAILGLAAWRLLPHPSVPLTAPQPEVAAPTAMKVAEAPKPTPTDHQQLHLAHAEASLVAAAEELAVARRLLAALGPDLSRSYLQFEKRRADRAWTSCDTAARAIEQARDDIKVVASTGKD